MAKDSKQAEAREHEWPEGRLVIPRRVRMDRAALLARDEEATKAELKEAAEAAGINVQSGSKKADIKAAIIDTVTPNTTNGEE